MALLEKKAFADLCGLKTKDLSNYQKRGKVQYTEGGLVDTSVLKNQVFYALNRHKGNGAEVDFDIPEAPQKQNKRAPKDNEVRSSPAKAKKETAAEVRQDEQSVPVLSGKKVARSKAAVPEKSGSAARKNAPDGDSPTERTAKDNNERPAETPTAKPGKPDPDPKRSRSTSDEGQRELGISTAETVPVAKHASSRKKVGSDEDDDEDDDIMMSTFQAENRYKSARAVKVTHEAELMKLKVAKVRGSVIPTELVMPVFIQHSQSILMAQKAADEEMLSDVAHRFNIPGEEVAALRGLWTTKRNDAMERAIEASEKSVDAILINFIDEKI